MVRWQSELAPVNKAEGKHERVVCVTFLRLTATESVNKTAAAISPQSQVPCCPRK